jgi:hypothetical protein
MNKDEDRRASEAAAVAGAEFEDDNLIIVDTGDMVITDDGDTVYKG